MSYLSRIRLKPGLDLTQLAKAIPTDAYGEHKLIWRLFSERSDTRDFLFRREQQGHWPFSTSFPGANLPMRKTCGTLRAGLSSPASRPAKGSRSPCAPTRCASGKSATILLSRDEGGMTW